MLFRTSLENRRLNAEVIGAAEELKKQIEVFNGFTLWASPLQIADAAALVIEKCQALDGALTHTRNRQLEAEFLNREATRQLVLATFF